MIRSRRQKVAQPYVMRTVVIAKAGDYYEGTHHDWLKLDCGHIVFPANNGRQFRVPGKSKARCFECAAASAAAGV